MRLGVFWRPDQAIRLSEVLGPGDLLLPLSQLCYAAAIDLRPDIVPQFWEVLRDLDLGKVEQTASSAIHHAITSNDARADIDRPAIWHNAREAAYVFQAVEIIITTYHPAELVLVGASPESEAAQTAARLFGTPIRTLEASPETSDAIAAFDPPSPLGIRASDLSTLSGKWIVALGTGLGDWGHNIPKWTRPGSTLVILLDAQHSGNLPALYAFCANRSDVRLVALWNETMHHFRERGNNRQYADRLAQVLDLVVAAHPAMGIISDLRRTETVIALQKLNAARIPVRVVAHSGASMREPYRFDGDELGSAQLEVWTASAAADYGKAKVAAPRRVRTLPARRVSRFVRRTNLRIGNVHVGIVITTAAQFAAPEHNLVELRDSFARLASSLASNGSRMTVRLRHGEDSEQFWKTATPAGADVAFEHSGMRSSIAFLRDADIIVEIGSETSMFLEAAGNFVPYVRLENTSLTGRRFGWNERAVPRLDPHAPWHVLATFVKSKRARVLLAIRQHHWLLRETRPTRTPAEEN